MKTPSWFLKKNLIAFALLPFAGVYYIASKIVFWSRLFRQKTSKRPVICVGNILAGGVGKTPIVREIAKRLNAPVIMRGYKRHKAYGIRHNYLGDEGEMLKSSGIDVYVGNRSDNIKKLNNKKCHMPYALCPIILDDGFQNPTIKKDLSIVVFDGKIGVGNGFILPAGPLREGFSALKRADAVMIVNRDKWTPKTNLPIFDVKTESVNPGLSGKVFLFAGIGFPDKFFASAGKLKGINVVGRQSFSDHYNYTENDLEKILDAAESCSATYIATTEKDWVRLPKKYQEMIDFIPLKTTIDKRFWTWLTAQKL